MRNTLIQTLPADTTLTINIEPPMDDAERHFVLTPGKRGASVVRVINNGCVSITNPTTSLLLIVFGVTRFPLVSPELRSAIATLIQKVRP